MKIGITGVTGFLGSYLLNHFVRSRSHDIKVLTRTLILEFPSMRTGVRWQEGDLISIKACEDFLCDLDVLIHLAHTNTPLTSNRDLPGDAQSNILPMMNLLQAIKETGHKLHFVYSSSGGAVYGASKPGHAFKETDPCKPRTSYGIQKLMGEHYLRMAAEQGWLTAVCLRISNPYGVLLPADRQQGLIGVALNKLIHGQPIRVIGNPENVRDYLHLDDLCNMFERVLVPRCPFDVFNVGSGEGHSVNQVLSLLERFSGRKVVREEVPLDETRVQLPSRVVLDVSKAKEQLGWEPGIKLVTGLEQLCDKWFRT